MRFAPRWITASLVALVAFAFIGPVTLGDEKKPATDESPLPKYMTEAEKSLPIDRPTRKDFTHRAPPSGAVHCAAEYEENEGLFIAWEGYTSVLTSMVVHATTQDATAKVFVVVDTTSEQSSASSTLNSAGADMSRVEFIVCETDTVWIRDYGPRFIFEDGMRAIIDHTYNRPRYADNAFPDFVSSYWDEAQYDIPLEHGGGNFHLFSTGDAFMTDLILSENPGLSEQDVIDLYHDYQNLNVTIYPGFPTSFDSTQHIDMWMLPVDDDEVIIGQYASSTGQPYTITENAVADLRSRGYTVYRTPGWNSGGTHYTYTNAVVMNDIVMMPTFGSSNDSVARTVFQTAFDDKTVINVDCSSIIGAAGAIHCTMMHIPAYSHDLDVAPRDDFESEGDAGGPFTPSSFVYTLENSSETAFDYEVTHAASWITITNASGTLAPGGTATVTVAINSLADAFSNGTYEDTVTFTNLTTGSGDTVRDVTLVVGVPSLAYSWDMDTNPGWGTENSWAWGQPQGSGGSEHGNPDPTAGHTGSNVCGYNLAGDYESSISPPAYLTTGAIDCSGLSQAELRFWRWLNVETASYDHASVQVSANGTSWSTIWENPSGSGNHIQDSAWTQQILDISDVADGEPTVYVRWAMGTTDGSWEFSGWNVDDVEIWGLQEASCSHPGDMNDDGLIDGMDVQQFVNCLTAGAPGDSTCACADVDASGVFDAVDVADFVASLLAP